MEQKTWQVYRFWKRNVSRLHLKESSEGFCWERKGRSLKTEKVREPTAESGVRILEAESIRSRAEYVRVCKVEDSHRDKMEQCP